MSETLLRYWREDPLLNEHHEHWHLVYPFPGRPDRHRHSDDDLEQIWLGKIKPRYSTWNERHGELFAYMHCQMLARYAAERLSVGLPAVVPFDDYRKPIAEGFDPGPNLVLQLGKGSVHPSIRPDYTFLKNITNCEWRARPGAKIEAQELFRDRLQAAVSSQHASNRPASISELAERIEPTERYESPYFGSLHNDGHLLISLHDDNPAKPGCMFWEAAAIRDPVFFRWHAHIDYLYRNYQDAFAPYDFGDLPPVEVTNTAIISESGSADELVTEMRSRIVSAHGDVTRSKADLLDAPLIPYLSHEDFSYYITAVNMTEIPMAVVVRIFMAPEESLNDRRAWIEMDKFSQLLKPGGNMFDRSSRESSVIRHPVWTADMLEDPQQGPSEQGIQPGCRCGWPYTLLLPRGTKEGVTYRFLTLLTPGDDLVSEGGEGENSASYCGLIDAQYPDKRPMGYPFDRPFKRTLGEWLDGQERPPAAFSISMVIKHIDHT